MTDQMQIETSLRLLPASDLHARLKMLENAAIDCRAELKRRPSNCQEPPPPQPATAASSCMLKLEDFPSELLVYLAETLGNPLALLVSKAHLSKAFCTAARTAQATLTTLNLACSWAYYSKITDAAVVAVTSACKQLTSLNLHGCHNITDAAVQAVASACKQLTTLHLGGCSNITDAAVAAVASGCKQLTTLNLGGCDISDAAVQAVALECKQLTSLNLDGCDNITEAAVQAVASACPHLTVHLLG